MNLDFFFVKNNCALNHDAYLNGCVLEWEITVVLIHIYKYIVPVEDATPGVAVEECDRGCNYPFQQSLVHTIGCPQTPGSK